MVKAQLAENSAGHLAPDLERGENAALTELADAVLRNHEASSTDHYISFMRNIFRSPGKPRRSSEETIFFRNPQENTSECPASKIHASIILWVTTRLHCHTETCNLKDGIMHQKHERASRNGRYIKGSSPSFIMIPFNYQLLSLRQYLYILYLLRRCVSLFPSWPSGVVSLSSFQVSRPRETGWSRKNWMVELCVRLQVHTKERNGALCPSKF